MPILEVQAAQRTSGIRIGDHARRKAELAETGRHILQRLETGAVSAPLRLRWIIRE